MTSFPETLRVGILVFEDFEPLDVWGFIQPFAIARFIGTAYGDPPPYPFEVVLISSELSGTAHCPAPVASYNGPRVVPDMFRDEAVDRDIDVLMVPGGRGLRDILSPDEGSADERAELFAWLRAMDSSTQIMASVCTGSALLAAAGVLDGVAATSNHQSFAWVTSFGPRVLWNNVSRWVDAGHHVTSAGVSAGTDMGFHLVSRLAGRAVAEAAALASEYAWRRDPEQPVRYPEQAKVPRSR